MSRSALILTGLLVGTSAVASPNSHTTFTVSRADTQVTTEIRAGSADQARRRLASIAARLRELPMVTSVDSNGTDGGMTLHLNPSAAVGIRVEAEDSLVRVRSQFLRGAASSMAKPGHYLVKLASVMKAINEKLVE
jgi:hypothetical protein